ncbi:MAG: efflux RND transporter periplasmic adaptor subunit [Planctomycetes bacterium]|nr:efflux RND transporter periplasmic adaptor subunit [Planctomycetota bacterium]
MARTLRVILPPAVVAMSAAVAWGLIATRPQVSKRPPEVPLRVVRVLEVHRVEHRYAVESQGVARPRTETDLVSEVGGRVVEVSEALRAGGYFEAGETLVVLDPRDYELAVVRALGRLAAARLRLRVEEAEREAARGEWESSGESGEAAPLRLRDPQVEEARAALEAEEAGLELAARDLGRTRLVAPFDGRVRAAQVETGQVVPRGAAVARLYAVDRAEVRLPVPEAELAFLGLALDRPPGAGDGMVPVALEADLAGAVRRWEARVTRLEGEVDRGSRVVHLVAEVEDPYGRRGGLPPGGAPLVAGLFVRAVVQGRAVADVTLLPRHVLHEPDRVPVVEAHGSGTRLRLRPVQVLRRERARVVVGEGLSEGDRVAVSPLESPTDGMAVRIAEDGP